MTKSELVNAVIERNPKDSKSHAATVRTVDAVFAIIMSRVSAGESVSIAGFGIFEQAERATRVYSNPQTGEKIEVPAHSVPRFKPSKRFKESVDK